VPVARLEKHDFVAHYFKIVELLTVENGASATLMIN